MISRHFPTSVQALCGLSWTNVFLFFSSSSAFCVLRFPHQLGDHMRTGVIASVLCRCPWYHWDGLNSSHCGVFQKFQECLPELHIYFCYAKQMGSFHLKPQQFFTNFDPYPPKVSNCQHSTKKVPSPQNKDVAILPICAPPPLFHEWRFKGGLITKRIKKYFFLSAYKYLNDRKYSMHLVLLCIQRKDFCQN